VAEYPCTYLISTEGRLRCYAVVELITQWWRGGNEDDADDDVVVSGGGGGGGGGRCLVARDPTLSLLLS
jgi:hypothetical protein